MSKVVAHFIATNFYGGPEKQIVNNAVRLKDCPGYDPIIISYQEGDERNELVTKAKALGIPAFLITSQGAFNLLALVELYRLLKDYRVELLVSHGYKANVVGRLVSCFCGLPMVAVSRGWTAENTKIAQYEKIDRLFLKYADVVVAVSDGQKRKVVKYGIDKNKVITIRNAIDLSKLPARKKNLFRKEMGLPEEAVIVATAGRLSPEKDHATLVEAANIICRQRDDIFFVVFGEGPLRDSLEKRIAEHGLINRFYLPGFVKNMQELYPEFDIFVLTSLTEGLPNVILEAFSCKIPVVATNVGGVPELIEDEKTGCLVSPGDVNGLVKKIFTLLNDGPLRKYMAKNSYLKVLHEFNYESQIEKYLELFDLLTGDAVFTNKKEN